MKTISKDDLIDLNFKQVKHIFLESYTLDIGRDRSIDVSSPGAPNEMVFISQHDYNDYRNIEDIITLKNYDYDGYITVEELETLIEFFTKNNKSK